MSLLQIPFKVILRLVEAIQSAKEDRLARARLGLKAGHTEYDLCLAYRALVEKHHPKIKGTTGRMGEINKAFDHLKKKFPGTAKRGSWP